MQRLFFLSKQISSSSSSFLSFFALTGYVERQEDIGLRKETNKNMKLLRTRAQRMSGLSFLFPSFLFTPPKRYLTLLFFLRISSARPLVDSMVREKGKPKQEEGGLKMPTPDLRHSAFGYEPLNI